MTRFETNGESLVFIGLNTSLYYDQQIFALAHELFHFITQTGKAYTDEEQENPLVEKMADRFAAELLLPAAELERRVIKEFGEKRIDEARYLRTLRFIARLQSEWWMPYHAIVNRLHEEAYLNEYNTSWKVTKKEERFESQSGIVKLRHKTKRKAASNLMNSITQDMKFRYSLMKYVEKNGVGRASRKYNKSKSYIYFWKARFDGSIESLACQSRRPHSHPRQHTDQELKLIRDMRRRNPKLGIVELWSRLRKQICLRLFYQERVGIIPHLLIRTNPPKTLADQGFSGDCFFQFNLDFAEHLRYIWGIKC